MIREIGDLRDIRERRLHERRQRAAEQINDAFASVEAARTTVNALMREDGKEIVEHVHTDAWDELRDLSEQLESLVQKYQQLTTASGLARAVDGPLLDHGTQRIADQVHRAFTGAVAAIVEEG